MKKYLMLGAVLAVLVPGVALAQFNTDLHVGSSGSDVTALQQFLTSQAVYAGPITGTFGPLTKKAVTAFQNAKSITPASGFFGPLSRQVANQILVAATPPSTPSPSNTASQQTYTTPSGAVVNAQGQLIQAPSQSSQINSALAGYQTEIQGLTAQINQLDTEEENCVAATEQQTIGFGQAYGATPGMALPTAQGLQQNVANAAAQIYSAKVANCQSYLNQAQVYVNERNALEGEISSYQAPTYSLPSTNSGQTPYQSTHCSNQGVDTAGVDTAGIDYGGIDTGGLAPGAPCSLYGR